MTYRAQQANRRRVHWPAPVEHSQRLPSIHRVTGEGRTTGHEWRGKKAPPYFDLVPMLSNAATIPIDQAEGLPSRAQWPGSEQPTPRELRHAQLV